MSVIRDTNQKRIQELSAFGIPYYPKTITEAVWDPKRQKMLDEVLDDIDNGGGGPGGPVLWEDVQNKPNTLSGYGIQNAYTKTEVDNLIGSGGGGTVEWVNISGRPTWIGPNKPSYTASEVGAIPQGTNLFSGNYLDLTNKPILGTMAQRNQISIQDLAATGVPSGITALFGDGSWKQISQGGGAWGTITGSITSQSDLMSLLSNKADQIHTHNISAITGLQGQLDSKAPTSHTHTVSQISDFPDGLNLIAGSNIAITESGSNVTISATGGGEPANRLNLVAGSNVSIQESGNSLIISSTGGGGPMPDTIDVEAGQHIALNVVGGKLQFSAEAKEIVPGSNINIVDNGNEIIISATGGGGGGTTIHSELTGRDAANSHPIGAITNLASTISAIESDINSLEGSINGAVQIQAGDNITITPNGGAIIISSTGGGGGGSSNWGSIGGTLSNQTDLQSALDLKANILSIAQGSIPTRSAAGNGAADAAVPLDLNPTANSVARRAANGQLRVATAVLTDAAIPLSQATTLIETGVQNEISSSTADLSSLPGYNASVAQHLTHDDSGVLRWENL